jgi:lipopolysaccharide/colanic/teichoic acid biosynthesis glycosyltransferase
LFINWGFSLILFILGEGNFFEIEEKNINKFFIEASLVITIFSFIIQYIINTYNLQNEESKTLLFYGDKNDLDEAISEIKYLKKDTKLLKVRKNKNFQNNIFNESSGIIISDYSAIKKANLDLIYSQKKKGFEVLSLLNWYEKEFNKIPTKLIKNEYELLDRIKSFKSNYELRIKRIGDIFISFLLLIITAPLSILISFLIYLEDQDSIFYQQVRTGLNGKKFKIIKFRSMTIDAEKEGIKWARRSDPRITKIGRIIRATRLDELPQLICVIKGSMSLIGPRPERPEIENKLLSKIPYYDLRKIAKPGISGWAQVNYPYGASVEDTVNKLSYDMYYLCNFSLLLDLIILFKTIKTVCNAIGYKPKLTNKVNKF